MSQETSCVSRHRGPAGLCSAPQDALRCVLVQGPGSQFQELCRKVGGQGPWPGWGRGILWAWQGTGDEPGKDCRLIRIGHHLPPEVCVVCSPLCVSRSPVASRQPVLQFTAGATLASRHPGPAFALKCAGSRSVGLSGSGSLGCSPQEVCAHRGRVPSGLVLRCWPPLAQGLSQATWQPSHCKRSF